MVLLLRTTQCSTNCQQHQQRPSTSGRVMATMGTPNRRQMLFWGVGLPMSTMISGHVHAQETLLPLPGAPVVETPLPKEYVDVSRKLIDTLTDAINVDVQGGEEKELRRAADPAKDLVKQWITKWSNAPDVIGNDSHTQIKATIQELGDFYRRNGQRARLPQEVGQSLLERLGVAAAALPVKDERSLIDRLLR